MKLSELFEYQLFRNNEGIKIYKNPSAKDIRLILKNSYVLTQVPDIEKIDDIDDEDIPYRGYVHNLDYPLRGVVLDGNVYIVDSYDTDHDNLAHILRTQGLEIGIDNSGETIQSFPSIPIAIEKMSTKPRSDLEDYKIGAPQTYVNDLKRMLIITRMKMPIGVWS